MLFVGGCHHPGLCHKKPAMDNRDGAKQPIAPFVSCTKCGLYCQCVFERRIPSGVHLLDTETQTCVSEFDVSTTTTPTAVAGDDDHNASSRLFIRSPSMTCALFAQIAQYLETPIPTYRRAVNAADDDNGERPSSMSSQCLECWCTFLDEMQRRATLRYCRTRYSNPHFHHHNQARTDPKCPGCSEQPSCLTFSWSGNLENKCSLCKAYTHRVRPVSMLVTTQYRVYELWCWMCHAEEQARQQGLGSDTVARKDKVERMQHRLCCSCYLVWADPDFLRKPPITTPSLAEAGASTTPRPSSLSTSVVPLPWPIVLMIWEMLRPQIIVTKYRTARMCRNEECHRLVCRDHAHGRDEWYRCKPCMTEEQRRRQFVRERKNQQTATAVSRTVGASVC